MRLDSLLPATLLAAVAACNSSAPSGPPRVPKLQAITFWNKTSAVIAGDLGAASRTYVVEAPELTGPGDDWEIRAALPGRNGSQHVRLRQLHDGVRVWGG